MEGRLLVLYDRLKDYDLATSKRVLKLAGLFQAPPRVVNSIYRWAKQKIAGGLLEFLESGQMNFQGRKYIKLFPESYDKLAAMTKTRNDLFLERFAKIDGSLKINFQDWKYFSQEEIERAKELQETKFVSLEKLPVTISEATPAMGRKGGYGNFGPIIEINPQNPFHRTQKTDQEMVEYLDEYFMNIYDTVEHETTHFAQEYSAVIKRILSGENSRIQRGDWHGKAPQDYHLDSDTLRGIEDRIERSHNLSYELHPHLVSNINKARRAMQAAGVSDLNSFKNYILDYIINSDFFRALKSNNQKAYRYAISIFYSELFNSFNLDSNVSPFESNLLRVGQNVQFIDGPMSGMRGVVKAVDGDDITVEIDIFGRKTSFPTKQEYLSVI